MTPFWVERFCIRFYEVEPNGRLAIPSLCRYLQEAADAHARSVGVSLQQLRGRERMWVIVRLQLFVFSQPFVHEQVKAETWPTTRIDGRRAYRDFRLRAENGELLAEAASLWLFLDSENHRPVRLPSEIDGERIADLVTAQPVESIKLAEPQEPTMFGRFQVGWRDLDANGHANNICYVEWLLETIPDSLRRDGSLRMLDVQFKNEVLLNETVDCASQQIFPSCEPAIGIAEKAVQGEQRRCFIHRLAAADGRTLAVARSEWEAQQL
jgi:medium-chain acyl-[acyl-carrier-protein] hydrolase